MPTVVTQRVTNPDGSITGRNNCWEARPLFFNKEQPAQTCLLMPRTSLQTNSAQSIGSPGLAEIRPRSPISTRTCANSRNYGLRDPSFQRLAECWTEEAAGAI
jgi:hypothetical protein